jgi:hypothetical protein
MHERRHPGADQQSGNVCGDRNKRGLAEDQRLDLLAAHPERAQRDVLPPTREQQSEDKDRVPRCGQQQRVDRVEAQQALDVQGRQAGLVLVESRLRGVDVQRVARAGAERSASATVV